MILDKAHTPYKEVVQIELTYEQVDNIIVNDLKEAIEMNWNDSDLRPALIKVLSYYMNPYEFKYYNQHINDRRSHNHKDN
jgi:hypothetical protein